jgi:Flp pilus assembly protein TadD
VPLRRSHLTLIFLIALALRLQHLSSISHAPFFGLLLGDARAYDLWAQHIALGDWLGHDVFYQAPLYPYLLGAFYRLAGRHISAILIVQAVLGAVSCGLVALASARLFSRSAGIAAGLLLAGYAPAIFFDGLLQKTVLDTLLVSLVLWLVVEAGAAPDRLIRWGALGIALGALSLSRENALVLAFVIAVWIVWTVRLHAPGRRRALTAFAAGVIAVLTPVTLRNHAVSGEWHLTTAQFGPNFFIGNNADATGMYRALRGGRGTAEFERIDATELAQQGRGRTLTPAEVSSYWARRAVAYIYDQPRAWMALMLRKTGLFLHHVEVADTEAIESYRPWSPPLMLLAPIMNFGVLLPLALFGVWSAWPRLRQQWVIPALALAYAGSVVAFYVLGRYREPVVPFIVALAAAGLTALPRLVEGLRIEPRRFGAALGAAAVGGALAFWPTVTHDEMQAVSENNLGTALVVAGRPDEALQYFEHAIELDPRDASPQINLGTTLQSIGRIDDAEAALTRVAGTHPDSGEAHFFLGKHLIDRGRFVEALPHLRPAVAAMPESLPARTLLGIALAAENHFDEAIGEFREVVRRDPAFPNASWNLGTALSATGNLSHAAIYLEDAVRRDPENIRVRTDLADLHNRRGIVQATQGSLADAIVEFQQALDLDAGFADARVNLEMARQRLARTGPSPGPSHP